MGAGSSSAGAVAAGLAELTVSSPRKVPDVSGAALFDPETRTYPFGDDDELEAEHPVWQRVALAVGLRRGSLPSTPNVGIAIERLKRATDQTAQKEAEYAARVALADLIDAGDVKLGAVTAVLPWAGLFYVDVQNLREPGSAARSLPVRP